MAKRKKVTFGGGGKPVSFYIKPNLPTPKWGFEGEWLLSDQHQRGCILEGLAQDLYLKGGSSIERTKIYEKLLTIATSMK